MSRPWMAFYPSDYLGDTGHLTLAEHGAYLLLICHYWVRGGLPTDERQLGRIVRASPDEWSQMRDVLSEFFTEDWHHKRIDRELAEAEDRYERRRAAGSKGGRARSSNAQAMLKRSSSNAQPTTTTTTTTSANADRGSAPKGTRLPTDFEPDLGEAFREGLSQAQAEREASRFIDHYKAAPGQRGVKTDWRATWRNWVRRAADDQARKPSQANSKRNIVDAAIDLMNGGHNELEEIFSNHDHAQQLSAAGEQSRPALEDLSGGASGHARGGGG